MVHSSLGAEAYALLELVGDLEYIKAMFKQMYGTRNNWFMGIPVNTAISTGIPINQLCEPSYATEDIAKLANLLPHLSKSWQQTMRITSKDQMDLFKSRPVYKIQTLKKSLQEIQITCSAKKGRLIEVITGEDLVELREIMK